jgi:hypothetical protein
MKKNMLITMEVINGQNCFSKLVMHEIKALNITIGTHTSKVAFNVISSPTNPIVIGLSWLILHNLQVDWHTKSLHFDVPQNVTLTKCENKLTSKNTINEGEGYRLDKACTKLFECDKYLGSAQGVKSSKLCLFEQNLSCKLLKKEMNS